jgi:N-acetylglucosaminyl-diphospho-decaprenol L-rhamnosyltransferase
VRDTETTDEVPATGQAAHTTLLQDLTAVVVDWNLPDHTIRCVRALVADGLPPDRVVVVENGSTDGTWATVSTELASSVLVRLASNVGFAAAINAGASVLPAGAYLLVNNDAFVHRPGAIQTMLGVLRRKRAGIVVPRVLNADLSLQPTVAPFTVPFVAFARASGLSSLVPNRWQPRVSTHWDHATSRQVQAAIGAVMLVDGDVWSQLGGLRESAFMYAEDLDLCWRAHGLGRTTWFVAEAEFIHLGGASSSKRWSSRERAEQIGRAEAAMIRTHLAPGRAVMALTFMRLGLAARVVWFSALRNGDAAESCRGFLAGLRLPLAPPEASPAAPAMEVVRPA